MPKPYSIDLRGRVAEEVESGASRREAAERYGLSPSVVVIWVQRFEETGSIAAKPSGGSTSPLERHAEFLLGRPSTQGGRAYHPPPLASDRLHRYPIQPARMPQFLSPCGLCSILTGIRSN